MALLGGDVDQFPEDTGSGLGLARSMRSGGCATMPIPDTILRLSVGGGRSGQPEDSCDAVDGRSTVEWTDAAGEVPRPEEGVGSGLFVMEVRGLTP